LDTEPPAFCCLQFETSKQPAAFSTGRSTNLSVYRFVAAAVEIPRLQERDDGDKAELAEEQMGRAGEMERRIRFKLTTIYNANPVHQTNSVWCVYNFVAIINGLQVVGHTNTAIQASKVCNNNVNAVYKENSPVLSCSGHATNSL
jgi:hypothetical protein